MIQTNLAGYTQNILTLFPTPISRIEPDYTRITMNFRIKSLLSCQIPPQMLSLQSQVPSVLTLFTPWPPVSVTVVHTLHSRDVSIVTRYCIKQSIVSGPRFQICQSQVAKICKPFIQDFAQAASPRTSGLLLRPHWTFICVTRTQEYKSS